MPKRDSVKQFLELASEAYDLGATPSPGNLAKHISPQAEDWLPSDQSISYSRIILLQHGIDAKNILTRFLMDLEYHHGSKRVELFVEWLQGKPLSSYSWWQRVEVLADNKRLKHRIKRYKGKKMFNVYGNKTNA